MLFVTRELLSPYIKQLSHSIRPWKPQRYDASRRASRFSVWLPCCLLVRLDPILGNRHAGLFDIPDPTLCGDVVFFGYLAEDIRLVIAIECCLREIRLANNCVVFAICVHPENRFWVKSFDLLCHLEPIRSLPLREPSQHFTTSILARDAEVLTNDDSEPPALRV